MSRSRASFTFDPAALHQQQQHYRASQPPQPTVDPKLQAFMVRSLSRNDQELAALQEIHAKLRLLKQEMDDRNPRLLLELGRGKIRLTTETVIPNSMDQDGGVGDAAAAAAEGAEEAPKSMPVVPKTAVSQSQTTTSSTASTTNGSNNNDTIIVDRLMGTTPASCQLVEELLKQQDEQQQDDAAMFFSESNNNSEPDNAFVDDVPLYSVAVAFLLHFQLRRRLLNRLARRLLRVSHAMDTSQVPETPALPSYGDLRLHIDSQSAQAMEQVRLEQERVLRQYQALSMDDAARFKKVENKDDKDNDKPESIPSESSPSKTEKDGDAVMADAATSCEKDNEAAKDEKEKELTLEERNKILASCLPGLEHQIFLEYKDAYEKQIPLDTAVGRKKKDDNDEASNQKQELKHHDKQPHYTMALSSSSTNNPPVVEDYEKIPLNATGIGATTSARMVQTASERKAEFQRYKAGLLSKIPNQPRLFAEPHVYHYKKRLAKIEQEEKDGTFQRRCRQRLSLKRKRRASSASSPSRGGKTLKRKSLLDDKDKSTTTTTTRGRVGGGSIGKTLKRLAEHREEKKHKEEDKAAEDKKEESKAKSGNESKVKSEPDEAKEETPVEKDASSSHKKPDDKKEPEDKDNVKKEDTAVDTGNVKQDAVRSSTETENDKEGDVATESDTKEAKEKDEKETKDKDEVLGKDKDDGGKEDEGIAEPSTKEEPKDKNADSSETPQEPTIGDAQKTEATEEEMKESDSTKGEEQAKDDPTPGDDEKAEAANDKMKEFDATKGETQAKGGSKEAGKAEDEQGDEAAELKEEPSTKSLSQTKKEVAEAATGPKDKEETVEEDEAKNSKNEEKNSDKMDVDEEEETETDSNSNEGEEEKEERSNTADEDDDEAEDEFEAMETEPIEEDKKKASEEKENDKEATKEDSSDKEETKEDSNSKEETKDVKEDDDEDCDDPVQKMVRPLSLIPTPSFYDQDYRRTCQIQLALMQSSLQDMAREKIEDATREYNNSLTRSTGLAERRVNLTAQLRDMIQENRSYIQQLNDDYQNKYQTALSNWSRRKAQADNQKLDRLMPHRHNPQWRPDGSGMINLFMRNPNSSQDQHVVARYIGGMVDAVEAIAQGRTQNPPSFREQFQPPPKPDAGISHKQRMEQQIRQEIENVEAGLRKSEGERSMAWRKMLKTKAEFEIPHVHQSRLIPVTFQNYHSFSTPPLIHSTQAYVPREVTARPPASQSASYVPQQARRPAAAPSSGASAETSIYSKYSASKVRARISSDGSVAPVSTPKRTKDGLFQRPAGRTRKGMEWDAIRGIWVKLRTGSES